MKERQFIALVENGRIPQAMAQEIAALIRPLEGKRVSITLAEAKKKRSGQQNRYYWGVVIQHVMEIFTSAGNVVDEEEVHEFLKEHVGKLSKVIIDPAGNRRVVVRGSASISTLEFEAYMETVRAWAAQFGVAIPMPNEDS